MGLHRCTVGKNGENNPYYTARNSPFQKQFCSLCIDKLLFTLGVKGLLCMRLGGVDTRCEKKMNEICDTTFGTFVTI